jgi:hypothetical protein
MNHGSNYSDMQLYELKAEIRSCLLYINYGDNAEDKREAIEDIKDIHEELLKRGEGKIYLELCHEFMTELLEKCNDR